MGVGCNEALKCNEALNLGIPARLLPMWGGAPGGGGGGGPRGGGGGGGGHKRGEEGGHGGAPCPATTVGVFRTGGRMAQMATVTGVCAGGSHASPFQSWSRPRAYWYLLQYWSR